MGNGWALLASFLAWLRQRFEALSPAAIGAYIQHLRQEIARHKLNAVIERANREEAQRSIAEFEAYRSDPDGTDRWLRERAGNTDKL